jgi:hypothetical protein
MLFTAVDWWDVASKTAVVFAIVLAALCLVALLALAVYAFWPGLGNWNWITLPAVDWWGVATKTAVVIATVLVVGCLAALVGFAGWVFWPYLFANGGGDCPHTQAGGVASIKPALWKLTKPTKNAKVVLALDDWVDQPILARSFTRVVPTAANRRKKPLLRGAKVRAFLLGGLATGARSLQLQPTATAYRYADGRAIRVVLCAKRSSQTWQFWRESPGRYKGTVHVTGVRLVPVDIPVELTIRAKRLNVVILALVISLIGAFFGAINSKEANVTDEQVAKKPKTHRVLRWAPALSGLVAGLAAAFVLYADDPTWGAHLGADTAKLLTVTFAAATAGLTVTAQPARVARQKLAASS